jgi:Zn-dependent protease with chaperone function
MSALAHPGGFALAHPGWAAGILVLLIAAPIAFALWARAIALGTDRRDTAWFVFIQRIQWSVLGFWILWFPAVQMLGIKPWLFPMVPRNAIAMTAVYLGLDLAPAMAMAVVLAAIAYPVQRRLGRTSASRGAILSAAVWQQIAIIVPIACFAAGGVTAFMGHARVGVGLFAFGVSVAIVASQFVRRATGTETHAVTSGNLRDRLFEMGRRAGVRIDQLFVMSRTTTRLANAFAMRRGTVMITDELLVNLSRRELDAVLAHELAHLRAHHPRWLALAAAAPFVIVIYGFALNGLPLGLPLATVATLLVFTAVSRRFEYVADRDALQLGADPEALISALANIHRLNAVPLEWGRWNATVLTHPTTVQRARAIARRVNLSDARVEELLSHGIGESDRYVVPATQPGSEPKVFSTRAKTSSVTALSWSLLGLQTLVPAVVVGLARMLTPEATRLAVLGVAFLVSFAVSLFACDRLLAWPTARLRQRVAHRLASQGWDPGQDAMYVGLAPDDRRRLYEGFFDWDLGFLLMASDRIAYRGEETGFSLRRDQIADIRLAAGAPGWIRSRRVELTWSDGTMSGVVSLRPAEPWRLGAVSGAARALCSRLERWRAGRFEAPVGSTSDSRLDLPSPAIGEVTSVALRDAMHPRTLGVAFIAGLLMSAVACLILGLPYGPERMGLADVTAATFLVHVAHRVPYWRYREPVRPKAATLERAA